MEKTKNIAKEVSPKIKKVTEEVDKILKDNNCRLIVGMRDTVVGGMVVKSEGGLIIVDLDTVKKDEPKIKQTDSPVG